MTGFEKLLLTIAAVGVGYLVWKNWKSSRCGCGASGATASNLTEYAVAPSSCRMGKKAV